PETLMPDLSPDLLRKMHAYWRAANYLSVGQIYLQDNPLLESPLRLEHIKPRLLGHWGTTPGIQRQKPPPGLIQHSDRGSQYAAADYRKVLDAARMIQSMSRKGKCTDGKLFRHSENCTRAPGCLQ